MYFLTHQIVRFSRSLKCIVFFSLQRKQLKALTFQMKSTTFLRPWFSRAENEDFLTKRVDDTIKILSRHSLQSECKQRGAIVTAVAAKGSGASARRDGTYVYVARYAKSEQDASGQVGFTSRGSSCPIGGSCDAMLNVSYACAVSTGLTFQDWFTGDRWSQAYYPVADASKIMSFVEEVVVILTIANDGEKKTIQFIVNGRDGPVREFMVSGFSNEVPDFEFTASVTIWRQHATVSFVPFGDVRYRSARIDELMEEYVASGAVEVENEPESNADVADKDVDPEANSTNSKKKVSKKSTVSEKQKPKPAAKKAGKTSAAK